MIDSTFIHRRGLLVTTVSPLLAIIIGSVFNIWYNHANIEPLLTNAQFDRFVSTTIVYNLVVYPVLLLIWLYWMFSLRSTQQKIRNQISITAAELRVAGWRVRNLPWGVALFCSIGWLGCIPVFISALNGTPDPLHGHVNNHLVVSFLIAGVISVTQAFFIAEICCLNLLYPWFFQSDEVVEVNVAVSRSLRLKWIMWAVSTVVCPVGALLLLYFSPAKSAHSISFAIAVGVIFVAFGLASAWLLGQLIMKPVRALRNAAQAVGKGDLDTRIDMRRADDFGLLIAEFNKMVAGLQEKEHLETTFGRHVGRQAARNILANHDGPSGTNRVITVMFVDVRNFTSLSSTLKPEQVVELLNVFFDNMVEIVESHDGMVNKFLGDGFMALFGAVEMPSDTGRHDHADHAVKCGIEMVQRMQDVNQKIGDAANLKIGIGIHSGDAVIGSIGSLRRLEYTAIGDTVNVASRVEGLTKKLKQTILITDSTFNRLTVSITKTEAFNENVKGKVKPLVVYGIEPALSGNPG